MYIKKIDKYRFTIPTGKGMSTFIARTREPIPEWIEIMNSARNILQKHIGTASAGANNSKLSSGELSNLNVVKYVYV